MKEMIHETLKSGGGITEAKGHDQELIVALMSVKYCLGHVILFHMYLVVAGTEFKFGKLLSHTKFIQKVIYDGNGEFVLDGKFVGGTKIRTHATSSFLLEDHDNKGRRGDGTRMDNT
jgi:hypothetical protein